ncbi:MULTISPECIES: DUF1045 domain-containing protein [unclassified Bradyrhizobium]|uniref:DUF1045 domain-containing protein n=1 Tax=unclassified Bradyrhizobium TaxID=2631580 RepID=UPI0033946D5C
MRLVRWGYPYVFDRFRFRMTRTDRATADPQPRYGRSWIRSSLPVPRQLRAGLSDSLRTKSSASSAATRARGRQ